MAERPNPGARPPPAPIRVTAYDLDAELAPQLRSTATAYAAACILAGIDSWSEVISAGLLTAAAALGADSWTPTAAASTSRLVSCHRPSALMPPDFGRIARIRACGVVSTEPPMYSEGSR